MKESYQKLGIRKKTCNKINERHKTGTGDWAASVNGMEHQLNVCGTHDGYIIMWISIVRANVH